MHDAEAPTAAGSSSPGSDRADTSVTPPRNPDRESGTLPWFAITLAVVLVASIVPMLFESRFYFDNDTESGAFGIWYKIGTDLRAGHLQIFNPHAWMAGNYVAEGQWGFFSPIVLLISLAASLVGNALIFCSVIKIIFLVIGAGGVFALARSFGADPRWSAAAGVAAPLAGFTMYMDAAAWVTGLFIWALLPWFWVTLRRAVYQGRNPFWALLTAYLTITFGYVYGAIVVIFILVGVGLETLVAREWRRAWTTVFVGVFCGLVTITVYLPGVLTASVTRRNTAIENDGFMQPTLTGLATGSMPTALPGLHGFWGLFPGAPIMYIAWFLPLLAFVDWQRARTVLRPAWDGLIVMALTGMLLFGPAEIAALRFPIRNMPACLLALLPLAVLLISRARAPRSTTRLATAVGLTMASAWLTFGQKPHVAPWTLVATAITIGGLWWVWRPTASADEASVVAPDGRRRDQVMAGVLAITLAFVVLQHHSYKRSDLADYQLPAQVAAYKKVDTGTVGDGILIGSGFRARNITPADRWREFLIGNTWYIGNHQFQNVYTPVGFAAYGKVNCTNYIGLTCANLLPRMFQLRGATGMLLVDELGLDTIQIMKAAEPESLYSKPPPGWSITSEKTLTITWTRDTPVGPVGKPVMVSTGTQIQPLTNTDRTVSFRVDTVPPGGGRVVFSRLNWPGYTATNATVAKPADKFLLQVKVPPGAVGKVVTVTFTPPAWRLGWATWGLALLGGLLWSTAALLGARRRKVAA
jgi:hypothetical protein